MKLAVKSIVPFIKWQLVFLLTLLISASGFSQNPSSNILIRSGGNVSFKVNSLTKYKNGIEYADWTEFHISFNDPDEAGNTWNMGFKAQQTDLLGDGGNTMPLDVIELEIVDGGGNNTLADDIVGTGVYTLASTETQVIEEAEQGDFQDNQLLITIRCGQGGTGLVNQFPDYYIVDLEFRVYPTNP